MNYMAQAKDHEIWLYTIDVDASSCKRVQSQSGGFQNRVVQLVS